MEIKEHFTDKEIKLLNSLSKNIKKAKWIQILVTIFLVVGTILNLRLAVIVGHRYGINGLMNVLLVWYKDLEVGKTYQLYEVFIAQRVANAHLSLGVAIILLIFYYSLQKIDNLLLKCWKLLSSEHSDNKEPKN